MYIPIQFQLTVLVIIEILCHTFLKDRWGVEVTSIIYLSVGLLIPAIAIMRNEKSDFRKVKHSSLKLEPILICTLLFMMVLHYGKLIFVSTVIDYKVADMLPVIDEMSRRFLDGGQVYDIIPEIWGGMQPIYLPAMWLPFVIHHIAEIDMRWISTLAMICGTVLLFVNFKKGISRKTLLSYSIPVFLIWTLILSYDHTLISRTQEGIVIGYYMLLCFALLKRYWLLVGVSIALCLLSRYALAPWTVVFILSLIIMKKYNEAKKVTIALTCTALPLILLTGSYPHFPTIFGMSDQYLSSLLTETDKYLPVIDRNLGLAKFLSIEQLPTLHKVLMWSSIVIPILGFGSYRTISKWFNRKIALEFYAICMLKLSLVCFYNLLIIPYSYLFYTSTFVSLFILVGYNLPTKQLVKDIET